MNDLVVKELCNKIQKKESFEKDKTEKDLEKQVQKVGLRKKRVTR